MVFRKVSGWLNGLLGRSVYRGRIPASTAIEMRSRLEQSIRSVYTEDGFDIRIEEYAGLWFLHAHRGLTGGFGVGLFPKQGRPGEECVEVGVVRTSRLDEAAGSAVGFLAVLAAVLSLLVVGFLGWDAPGIVLVVAIALGTAVVTLMAVYQLIIPTVAMLEYFAGGRLDRAQISAVVELVRGVIARCSDADPDTRNETPNPVNN